MISVGREAQFNIHLFFFFFYKYSLSTYSGVSTIEERKMRCSQYSSSSQSSGEGGAVGTQVIIIQDNLQCCRRKLGWRVNPFQRLGQLKVPGICKASGRLRGKQGGGSKTMTANFTVLPLTSFITHICKVEPRDLDANLLSSSVACQHC